MSVPELLAVGETMAMVAPAWPVGLADAAEFRIYAGGAESNVAAHVAALGHSVAWFSRLGDDPLGHRVVRQLAERDVDISSIVFDADRPTGVYFKDPGRSIHYYRAGSAASALSHEDVDLLPLAGVRILHLSGITLALSATAAGFVERAIERAREEGILVSFDVNYRPQLWPRREAADVLERFSLRADIVFVGRDEAEGLWGTADALSVRERFADVPELVVKDGDVGATVYSGDESTFEPAIRVDVVEQIGAGDAFAGGYLAARLEGEAPFRRLQLGHARAILTLKTTSDLFDDDRGRC